MSGTFSANTDTIVSLLGRTALSRYTAERIQIPALQREYSWEREHISTYWSDVNAFVESRKTDPTKSYFMGPLVAIPRSTEVELLDGQQRLATCVILLCELRNKLREIGTHEASDLARDIHRDYIVRKQDKISGDFYSLVLNSLDAIFFQKWVQEDPPNRTLTPVTLSHKAIQKAVEIFKHRIDSAVDSLPSSDQVNWIETFVSALTHHIKYVFIEVENEADAYTIFESLNDRGLRLQVPDLLLNHLLKCAPEAKRDSLRSNWDQMVRTVGTRSVSEFLRRYWVSMYGDQKSRKLYKVISDEIPSAEVSAEGFVLNALEAAKHYSDLLDFKALGKAHTHVHGIIHSLKAHKAVPLLLVAKMKLSSRSFEKVAKLCADIIVLNDILAGHDPVITEEALFSLAKKIYEAKSGSTIKSDNDVVAMVRTDLEAIKPDRAQISAHAQSVYLNTREATYLLKGIDVALRKTAKAIAVNETTLEHIFPQKAKEADWPNKDDLQEHLWAFGNLALLYHTENSSAGNKAFATKLSVYKSSLMYVANDISDHHTSWTLADLNIRASRMAKAAMGVWNLA